MEQTIQKLAETVSGAGEDEAALLEALCGAAIRRWRGRLREGLTAEDCGTAFHCAAAFTAAADLLSGGGDSAASFTAGQVSVKARTAADSAARSSRLARENRSRSRLWQASALMTRTPEAFSRMTRTTVSTAAWALV